MLVPVLALSACVGSMEETEVGGSPLVRTDLENRVRAGHSDKCLDVREASQANGAAIQQWECNPRPQANQVWRFVRVEPDAYQIVSRQSGKCLDVRDVSQENGAAIQQWDCGGAAHRNQLFRLLPSGSLDRFGVQALHSGKCLDVTMAGADDGALVQQWDCALWTTHQLWRFEPTSVPPMSRIVVSAGGFVDSDTGAPFVPRGNSFTRIAGTVAHTTFDPGLYDAARAEAALREMARVGYNVVRVVLPSARMGGDAGRAIDQGFIVNVADFLRRARDTGLRVILTAEWLPPNYATLAYETAVQDNLGGATNLMLMHAGHIEATGWFWFDVLTSIRSVDSELLTTLFAVDLRNEPYFDTTAQPFSLTSGTIRLPDGTVHDMSDATERQRAADEAAVYWADRLSAHVRAVDPAILVTAGVFSPKAVRRPGFDGLPPAPDARVPLRLTSLARTSLDYLDLHHYPGFWTFDEDMATAEVALLSQSKPLVMGEFGAYKLAYADAVAAAYGVRGAQRDSCRYGFDGWLFWTWDTWEQGAILWTIQDHEGAINGLLAPIATPDVCDG